MDGFLTELLSLLDEVVFHTNNSSEPLFQTTQASCTKALAGFFSRADIYIGIICFLSIFLGFMLAKLIYVHLPELLFRIAAGHWAKVYNRSKEEVDDLITKYIMLANDNAKDFTVRIDKSKGLFQHGVSANAGYLYEVIFNGQWYKLIIQHGDDPMLVRCFLETLGHELAHKKGDLPFREVWNTLEGKQKLFCYKYFQFANWVKEIHHDHYGFAYCGIASKKDLDDIIFMKCDKQVYDHKNFTHPAWSYRHKILNDGKFDKSLIDKIAKDMRCDNNDRLKKTLLDHYGEILLRYEDRL